MQFQQSPKTPSIKQLLTHLKRKRTVGTGLMIMTNPDVQTAAAVAVFPAIVLMTFVRFGAVTAFVNASAVICVSVANE